MLLRVEHITQSDYAPDVEEAWHLACLRPLHSTETGGQRLISHELRIEPQPSTTASRVDSFGNSLDWFCLHRAHGQCKVSAVSWLDTAEPLPIGTEVAQRPWQVVRESLRYAKDKAYQAETEFLHNSPMVQQHDEFLAFAQFSFLPKRSLLDSAKELSQRIHREFRYDSASTDVNTPPLQALRERHGVCQDFAHVLIACLRSLGLAARYVSGYLLTHPPEGLPRLIGADASHAWASVYLGEGQWLDLDPTNDRSGLGTPGADYVTLARGRDYHDVAPLKGILHGAHRQSQTVAVTVEPQVQAA